MGTVIIGGGDKARQAIADLESASLTMTEPQRTNAKAIFSVFVAQVNGFIAAPQPPA